MMASSSSLPTDVYNIGAGNALSDSLMLFLLKHRWLNQIRNSQKAREYYQVGN